MRGKLSRTLFQTKAVSLLRSLEVTQRLASMGARQIVYYNQLKLKMNIVLRFLYAIYLPELRAGFAQSFLRKIHIIEV